MSTATPIVPSGSPMMVGRSRSSTRRACRTTFTVTKLRTVDDAAHAIRAMLVRGAPLIGATAAYGICLALREDASDGNLERASRTLLETRPTAVNLRWALDQMMNAAVGEMPPGERVAAAYEKAARICDDDVAICSSIGDNGHSGD